MSLRRPPTRTPALLAANRANAQKSTGPHTPEGKNRVALSALRHGSSAPDFLSTLAKSSRAWEEFSALYRALYAALLPDQTDEGTDLLSRAVLRVWAMKQYWTRWAASRAEREAWFAQTGGVCPASSQWIIECQGWRVRVSVWVRWGRGRGHRRWLQTAANWKERRARLHVVVTITASLGHPLLASSRLEKVPKGIAPRVVFKLKPESARKREGNENVIGPSRFHQGAELPALARDRDDPISRHIASVKADLLSWLRPENVALAGPRLSESENIESWIEAIVSKWEKEHRPIPKKELLPHEIR